LAGFIARGLLAGGVAGFAAGLFYLVIGEPLIEAALAFEAPSGGHELFSRDVQRVGLIAATVLYGLSLGGLFAVAYLYLAPRLRSGTAWERSVRMAAAAFVAIWLIPFLKYPSNPPAVGEPATAELRSNLYLLLIAISIGLLALAYLAARRLEDRGLPAHVRLPAVAVGWALLVGLVFTLLPDNPDPVEIPASLLWDMRLASAGGQLVLWSVIGVAFGALVHRRLERWRGWELSTAGR
jgi:hypothetical protein